VADPNNKAIMNIRCNQLAHSNVNGRVLEIGVGTGINFPCLHDNPNIESYVGIEPNVHMYPFFYDFIKKYQIPFEISLSNASATDMSDVPSNSIDTVIMTLVLCSVPDPLPKKVISEVHRILKPGGKFLFLEHIQADPSVKPVIYGIQRAVEPVWAIIGDGCRFKPITDYFDDVKNVFSRVEYEKFNLPVPIFFIKDGVKGILVKW